LRWQAHQTRRLARVYKKLTNTTLIADTDTAVATVADNPDVGERKKGDLAQLWVYKFRSQGQLYLLGYTREDEVRLVYLEALGPHENFYLDLKRRPHGTDLENWWIEHFAHGFDALTESEARYLARTETADTIRDRIAEAEQTGIRPTVP
jgi:mRNA interferase RelE/StbE